MTIFTVNFEHISKLFLVFLLLTLNRKMFAGKTFVFKVNGDIFKNLNKVWFNEKQACNSITLNLPWSNGNTSIHRFGRWKTASTVENYKKQINK